MEIFASRNLKPTKYQPRLSLPRPSHVESKANQLQKGFLDEKNDIFFFLGGGSNVNVRQVLVDNKWPNKSSVLFVFGKNCFIRLLWGLTSGLNMAITSSTVWTSKNQDLLKDPWKTSCCYRPFLLPLLPSAGSSDKTLWLWLHRSPKFGCNNVEALHARLQGFPTSGMALNTFSLYCPQTAMSFVRNIRLNFLKSPSSNPKETCHLVRWVWFSVTQSAGSLVYSGNNLFMLSLEMCSPTPGEKIWGFYISWSPSRLNKHQLFQWWSQRSLQLIFKCLQWFKPVDGRNPANQLIWRIYHSLQGFYLSQLVQDFFHQQ